MKTTLPIVALAAVLFVASPCFALIVVEGVTKERAAALGVVVRSKPVNKAIYVWLEFKAEGELKGFERAQLAVESGDRWLTATLQSDRKEAAVEIFVGADPQTIADGTVTLIVRHSERGLTGYQFKLKDFVELKAVEEKPK